MFEGSPMGNCTGLCNKETLQGFGQPYQHMPNIILKRMAGSFIENCSVKGLESSIYKFHTILILFLETQTKPESRV